MRKIDRFLLSAAAVIVLSLCSVAADAHEFWINAKAPEGGVLKADIGFGHGFPDPETIPEDRIAVFIFCTCPDRTLCFFASSFKC